MKNFFNAYESDLMASAYNTLEFKNTYHLAYRDLPDILNIHAKGKNLLDFGCGAGRSTRFFQNLGFNTTGIDISQKMITWAKNNNPEGTYYLIQDGDFSCLKNADFDVITSIFTFDNIPSIDHRVKLFSGLKSLLNEDGKIILLGSQPEIYIHEWASFSTKDFLAENEIAKSGDFVKIINLDVPDKTPVMDVIWWRDDYEYLFKKAGLKILDEYNPKATGEKDCKWISETKLAPWFIWVLGQAK